MSQDHPRQPKKKRRPIPKPGSSSSALVVVAVLAAGGLGFAVLRRSAPAPSSSRALSEESYVDGRSSEILRDGLKGVPSAGVSDAFLERMRESARQTARSEYRVTTRAAALARETGDRKGARNLNLAAVRRIKPWLQDRAKYGAMADEEILRVLEIEADRVRLDRRIGR